MPKDNTLTNIAADKMTSAKIIKRDKEMHFCLFFKRFVEHEKVEIPRTVPKKIK